MITARPPTEREELIDLYSDLYKDLYGYRPRALLEALEFLSLLDLNLACKKLSKELEAHMSDETNLRSSKEEK